MKPWISTLLRIGVCVALALPAYFLGMQGLVGMAFTTYIAAVAIYWCIQLMTDFRNPLSGAFVVALVLCLLAVFLPALARAGHTHPL
jgi:hypothetical protein